MDIGPVTAKPCNSATKAVPPSSGCIAPSQRGGRGGFLTYSAGADHRRARQPATADPQQPVDPAWFNSRWPFRAASRSLGLDGGFPCPPLLARALRPPTRLLDAR